MCRITLTTIGVLCLVWIPATLFALIWDDPDIIRQSDTTGLELLQRGDANNDGTVDISDITTVNNWLFLGGTVPPCLNQADANNDGAIDVTDSVFLSGWLFGGGPAPEPPEFPSGNGSCGIDSEPVGCAASPCRT